MARESRMISLAGGGKLDYIVGGRDAASHG